MPISAHFIKKPEVHYLAHKSLLLVPILSQINQNHATKSSIAKKHINIIPHLYLGLRNGFWLSHQNSYFPCVLQALSISSS
jgi:hypothetical protein